MSTKIQSKPLYASLVAVIMATALAMSSIGIALALPDSDTITPSKVKTALDMKTTEQFYQWLKDHLDDEACPFCSDGLLPNENPHQLEH